MFCAVHLHVSLHQSVYGVYGPSEAAEQDDDQDNNDQSRKSPAQQEVEQVSTLCVLVIHHQHLPEVHRLGTKFEKTTCVRDSEQKNRLCANISNTFMNYIIYAVRKGKMFELFFFCF